jgi:hypothetical protein
MQVRSFRVPFGQVCPEATELDFGPDDYLVVRPLFGLSKTALEGWTTRFGEVTTALATDEKKAAKLGDRLLLDLMGTAIVEWHLAGPDGPIPQPGTIEAVNALPGAIAGSLLGFLSSYRGEAPGNPTTSS